MDNNSGSISIGKESVFAGKETGEKYSDFDNDYYCIACDSCGIVKFKDKYFNISNSERSKVEKIFKKYGGTFPCV